MLDDVRLMFMLLRLIVLTMTMMATTAIIMMAMVEDSPNRCVHIFVALHKAISDAPAHEIRCTATGSGSAHVGAF